MTKYVEPAIVELLKSLAPHKVFMMRAKQGEIGPFIIIQRADAERWRAINGPSGFVQANIQVDVYSTRYTTTKALAGQVESILDGYKGVVYYGDDSPQEFVRIAGVSLQNDIDIPDQTDEPFLFRNSMTFLVTYQQ